ncbi:tyrosine aminotransferase-like [Sycon ciliatum]|uniref:tyrosine aminotransferase-like n=1 Tax=Sycon ciliatum TaxID=27933 RepID=UPI0020A84B1B|eukprot:scpid71429/ scgid8008/ Tyrosine aminotransferase; L-tyrosine:2-oxoglutarate aminotransferase
MAEKSCNGLTSADGGAWVVDISTEAKLTINPIRAIVDALKVEPNPDKEVIRLSIGDPTAYGNLPPSKLVSSAVAEEVENGQSNGYCLSFGSKAACSAVAEYYSTPEAPLTCSDVVLASGCSGALSMAINVLTNPGDNILIPCPGFSLYRCLASARQVEARSYRLIPEKSWEIDLDNMESLIDENTKAIVVNNPSNPCGSVYTLQHLKDIAAVAYRRRVPIISDEVYAGMAFHGTKFHSMAQVAPNQPILTCGGLAKKYLVPGWRLGWVFVHDQHHVLDLVREGLRKLSTQILGPCSLIQAALPAIIRETPQEFFDNTIRHCEEAAGIAFGLLSEVPSLTPVMPSGAMYMMIGIKTDMLVDIDNDIQFTEKLMAEESVFCLPAQCFQYPDFFRIVLCVPMPMMSVACSRISEFCHRHQRQTITNGTH